MQLKSHLTMNKLSKTCSFLFAASLFLSVPVVSLVAPIPAKAVVPTFDFTELVEKTSPAVVNIRTTQKVVINQGVNPAEQQMQELWKRFFGVPLPQNPGAAPKKPNKSDSNPTTEEVPRGVGSGFFISQDGYVMTNAHVVDGADEVYIKLTDKREFKAKVVGIDKRTDVALIKVDGTKLPFLQIGDSDKIKAGEWVVAIGSPFDLENSVSAGIVSAKSRDTGDLLPLIQTDVAVNPGNSGGPLLNMNGEVVGINSQIYSRSGGFMGISFAVPIDEAMRVVEQLKSGGKVSRSRIGVRLAEVPKDVAETFGLAKGQGASVSAVDAGLAADKAGIVAGDIILEFNGKPIAKWSDLSRFVANTKPGTKATVVLFSKGKTRTVTLVTGEMEADKVAKAAEENEKTASNSLGLQVKDLTEEQKRDSKEMSGVVVENSEGGAARAGIMAGDLIPRLNYDDIKDAKQFNALVAKLDKAKNAVVLVKRGGISQFVIIKPPTDK